MNLLALLLGPSLLINLLVTLLIVGLIWYLITILPLPPLFLKIAQIILVIFLILWLASLLTSCAGSTTTLATPYGSLKYKAPRIDPKDC